MHTLSFKKKFSLAKIKQFLLHIMAATLSALYARKTPQREDTEGEGNVTRVEAKARHVSHGHMQDGHAAAPVT